jgi:hypothetical protein
MVHNLPRRLQAGICRDADTLDRERPLSGILANRFGDGSNGRTAKRLRTTPSSPSAETHSGTAPRQSAFGCGSCHPHHAVPEAIGFDVPCTALRPRRRSTLQTPLDRSSDSRSFAMFRTYHPQGPACRGSDRGTICRRRSPISIGSSSGPFVALMFCPTKWRIISLMLRWLLINAPSLCFSSTTKNASRLAPSCFST